MMFPRLLHVALVLMAVCTAASVHAEELSTTTDLASLCEHSKPSTSPDAAMELVSRGAPVDGSVLTSQTLSTVKRLYTAERSALLLEEFEVRINPGAWKVATADDLLGELLIPTHQPLELMDPRYGLQLSSAELQIPCDPEHMSDVDLAIDAGLVALDLKFELAASSEPSKPFCTVDEEASLMVVAGNALHVELVHVGSGDTLCRLETRRGQERRVQLSSGREENKDLKPEVEVTKVELLDGETALEPALEQQLRREIEAALMPCYQQAICRTGPRQGALTLRVAGGDNGQLGTPTVTVDALDSELITGCAMTGLSTVRIDAEAAIPEVGVVVIFRLLQQDEHGKPRWFPAMRAIGRAAIHGVSGAR